jgi:hypothetical protein
MLIYSMTSFVFYRNYRMSKDQFRALVGRSWWLVGELLEKNLCSCWIHPQDALDARNHRSPVIS